MLIYMPHRHTWAEGVLNRPPVPSTLVVVQSLSRIWLFVTLWTAAHRVSLSFTISRSLLRLMSTGTVMLSNHLILCHSLFLLPSLFPASGSFPVSHTFTSGGQSIGDSASVSVLPMNNQGWFPLGLTGLISLQSKGLSRFFSSNSPNNLMKYLSHYTDEEAEVQRGSVACWRWPSLWEDTVAK